MRLTVDDIMTQIAASVNQEATSPTGAEYTLWLAYINRAVAEWSEAHDWEVMKKTYLPSVTAASTATVPLPTNFKKLSGPVKYWSGNITGGEDWPEILPEEISIYNTQDKYFTITGDISSGFYLLWNPATLPSGASISIPYYSMPTSLASPSQVPVVTDSQFLVDRTIGFILESRSDSRFQETETKARDKLLEMVENAKLAKYNPYTSPQPVSNTLRRQGFRMGRD
jgi:hypothetical protein